MRLCRKVLEPVANVVDDILPTSERANTNDFVDGNHNSVKLIPSKKVPEIVVFKV